MATFEQIKDPLPRKAHGGRETTRDIDSHERTTVKKNELSRKEKLKKTLRERGRYLDNNAKSKTINGNEFSRF